MEDFEVAEIDSIVAKDQDPGFRGVEWEIAQYLLDKDEAKCGLSF